MSRTDDDFYYDDEHADDRPRRRTHSGGRIVEAAFDWGLGGSILAIIALTIVYAFLPLDLIPDFIPVAGQADDVAALLAGGGSVTFLALLRFALRTRIGRWGCLIVIAFSAVGGFIVFWLLLQLFEAIT